MMLARLAGATVLTSDPMPERRAVSERLGASAALDPGTGKLAEEIRARTEGRGADAVLVAVPLPAALSEGLALARPGGRVLLFAQNDPHMKIEFPAAAVGVEEKEILGSYSAAVDRQEESARLGFFAGAAGGGVDHASVSAGGVCARRWRWPRVRKAIL